MALYVGTSGWAYSEWRGSFYPAGLPAKSFLDHYGRTLTACEVNATLYRIQSEASMARCAGAGPDRIRTPQGHQLRGRGAGRAALAAARRGAKAGRLRVRPAQRRAGHGPTHRCGIGAVAGRVQRALKVRAAPYAAARCS